MLKHVPCKVIISVGTLMVLITEITKNRKSCVPGLSHQISLRKVPEGGKFHSKQPGVYPRVIHVMGTRVAPSTFLPHTGCPGRSFTHQQCHIHASLSTSATFSTNLSPGVCEYRQRFAVHFHRVFVFHPKEYIQLVRHQPSFSTSPEKQQHQQETFNV